MHSYVHCSVITITKIWKQPKCLSVDEWIKKAVLHLHNGIPSHKKKELLSFAAAWMNPESIMLSEISQSEKDKYRIFHLYVESNEQNKLTSKVETES